MHRCEKYHLRNTKKINITLDAFYLSPIDGRVCKVEKVDDDSFACIYLRCRTVDNKKSMTSEDKVKKGEGKGYEQNVQILGKRKAINACRCSFKLVSSQW